MAKPTGPITPVDRVEKWKKKWGAVRLLDDETTEADFAEFQDALVPGHMQKRFANTFGVPRAVFGNRYFVDDAKYQDWDTKFTTLLWSNVTHVEATVIYASPDSLEAHRMRGEIRRTLRDVIIDDWQAACAIVRGGDSTLYVFVEPKMRGCIVVGLRDEEESKANDES